MNLTKNFTLAEFNFRGLPLDADLEAKAKTLAQNLQAIRDFLGAPVKVTSWYRPNSINANAGGSKTSQHLVGEAMDFVVPSLDAQGLNELFHLIIDSKIKLPYACSQIIRETKNGAEWVHIGLKTENWLNAQKATIASKDASSAKRSKAMKRLTHCECLRTLDAVKFELVKFKPYEEFG